MLSDAQRAALLYLAHESLSIVSSAADTSRSSIEGRGVEVDLPLPHASGVFVTLKRRGELRGCLGTLQLNADLGSEVARCAIDAATEDPRFPPVAVDEIPELTVEISVLGPLERIDPADSNAIVIGRHGLVVERGLNRGLLLPQVATEWGWTVEQFLRQTCRKAGLPEGAWQHGAQVFRFEAEVFGD